MLVATSGAKSSLFIEMAKNPEAIIDKQNTACPHNPLFNVIILSE